MPNMPDSGTIALEQLGLMNNQFASALAPFNQYSNNLLTLAIQRRQREQQLQDAATARAQGVSNIKLENSLSMARQVQQQEFQKQQADAAHKAVIDEINLQNTNLDKREKEKRREDLVDKANRYGAKLPKDATLEQATDAFVKFAGERYIAAMKAAGTSVAALQQAGVMTPSDQAEIARRVSADPDVAAVLTPAQREQIRLNPQKFGDILHSYAGNTKAYDALNKAADSANTIVQAELTKRVEGKSDLQVTRFQLQNALEDLKDVRKEMGGISPMVEASAWDAYNGALKAGQPAPPAAPGGQQRPGPGSVLGPSPDAQPQAVAPPQAVTRQPGFLSSVGPALRSAASVVTSPLAGASRLAGAGYDQLTADLFGRPSYPTAFYTNPNAAGNPDAPLFPVTPSAPSSQGQNRLLAWLMQQQQARNLMTPLSAPAVPASTNASPIQIDF